MAETRIEVWNTEPVPLREGLPVTREGLTPWSQRELPELFSPFGFHDDFMYNSRKGQLEFTTVGERMARLAMSGGNEVTQSAYGPLEPKGMGKGKRKGDEKGAGKGKGKGKGWLDGCSSRDTEIVDTRHSTIDCNGFLQALDIAYNFHQGLRLRPDDIWLLIAMGFSMHINHDPEKYRHLLVSFEGKTELDVENDKVWPTGGCHNDWVGAGVFGQFSEKIQEHIGGDLHRMLVADFTTTTPLDRAVSEIVLMDTTKAYFNYNVYGMCGIPYVVLEGTQQDWEAVRQRVDAFSEFDLDWWLEDLRYVLDQFVAAKRGQVDVQFWKRMYRGDHTEEEYHQAGATYVSGWVHVLFPYLNDKKWNRSRGDSHLAIKRRCNPETAYAVKPGWRCASCGCNGAVAEGAFGGGEFWCRQCWRAQDLKRWYKHRVEHFDMPTGFRKVPFKWTYYSKQYDCLFLAGFAGCALAAEENEVRPEVAYCVLNKGLINAA